MVSLYLVLNPTQLALPSATKKACIWERQIRRCTCAVLIRPSLHLYHVCFTGQRVFIEVDYEPVQGASETTMNKTLWATVVGCFALLVVTVVIFIRFLDRPNRSQSSIAVPAPPRTPGPATPDHSRPAVLDESPRTPQPFVDYVRRTIDETPYYRRDGRRRFNLQNTL